MRLLSCAAVLLLTALCQVSCAQTVDADRDGDGLSDFQETYKYLTDPDQSDSDGDGRPDNDWLERREYQYTIRSVVQVMKPVTAQYISDDYQDARILDETDYYVEMEVIHYPFNRVASALKADKKWRETIRRHSLQLNRWLESGPTSDWTPELTTAITRELSADGIELDKLDDRQTVEAVSRWLLKRADFHDGFSTFITAFDESGNPFIPEALAHAPDRTSKLTPEQQWEREISAAGMFENRVRGSCTSSAIYLSGCLRAIGVPTRTVLCIPIIDASDERELDMVRRLSQPGVRKKLLGALTPLKGSWASHTFNEVYVGGRWRRLNYDRLGQNTYDPNLFGLMTHVATFADWSEARMHETIGRRQKLRPIDVFGGSNPYSTISLRDQVGIHCTVELPVADREQLIVERLHWTDSHDLPQEIRDNCERRGRFGLIAEVTGFADNESLRGFLASADLQVELDPSHHDKPQNSVALETRFDSGCYWINNNVLRIYVPLVDDRQKLVIAQTYDFRPKNGTKDFQWVSEKLTVTRRKGDQ